MRGKPAYVIFMASSPIALRMYEEAVQVVKDYPGLERRLFEVCLQRPEIQGDPGALIIVIVWISATLIRACSPCLLAIEEPAVACLARRR